ncbi:uncharacterized protein CELE_R03H10.2 [Caenorhabditis elegans]|uniref:Transmembrane protein n=1 Tax=Caenorhabditis elegans TaxID=6239 RepID=Q9GYM4_CAEEL|nr:Transmembrane protein [Caenorhabditis elegans]CCD70300.1 Transmembrane protein [Caenorhabditis elegans]|eukprot:NP_494728.1 Uncharacterized protein CELE_R03H10.2 [Caenorhabditis elegans]
MDFDFDSEPKTPPQLPPAPPIRTVSNNPKVTFKGAQTWRESVGMFLVMALALAVAISSLVLLCYVWKDKQVYDHIVDFLDKTIQISKIAERPFLGVYQLSEKELEVLGNERTYKWFLRGYLLSELGVFFFIFLASFLYFCFDISGGKARVVFWLVLATGILYAVVPIHVFTFVLMPYSNMLPNATEKILNHAIPHNVGGIQQMEIGLGCTFDLNLYAANRRKLNPNNTCDPQIDSSFIPIYMLIGLLVIRLLPIVLGVLLAVKKTPLSEGVAQLVEKLRKGEKRRLYVKKQQRTTTTFDGEHVSKSTTFGVDGTPPRITSTPLPPVPSPAQIDHSISYNNAAYFATSGAFSSRSSDISRIDASELFKNPINRAPSGSLQSEV